MIFSDKYTTAEKIEVEKLNPEIKEKIEPLKTTLSNDAFALGESINLFNRQIQNLIRSFAK